MSESVSKKLKLEEYKNEVFLYKDLEEEICKKKDELGKLKADKISLKDSNDFSIWILYFFSFLFFLWFTPYIILRAETVIEIISGLLVSIITSIIIGLYTGVIFSAILYCNDFVYNMFSFGKLNELKKLFKEIELKIEELKKLKEKAYKKIEPFEKDICDFYELQLSEFFEKNLYKKRSGSKQFEESIAEFSSMIEGISTINSNLITKSRIYLYEHKKYLEKRVINHNIQIDKESEKVKSIRNFVKSISEPKKQKEIISPEKTYRTARKINNWEEINKKRKNTGLEGEEIVVLIEQEFFESIGRKDLSQKVRHVSVKDGDGLGYDVLSFFENGKEKYIEVKSTKDSINSNFFLSRNELSFLKEHPEDSFIYKVLISDEIPQIISYSSNEILEKNHFIPVQYIVKMK